MPYNASGGIQDSAEILLRAELLNATALADSDRIYIKVFNAVNDLTGNADVSADETVCVLSNGNPINLHKNQIMQTYNTKKIRYY